MIEVLIFHGREKEEVLRNAQGKLCMPAGENNSRANYLSVPEAAKACGVSRNTMFSWVKAGKINAYQTPGNTNRIHPEDLVRFMEENGMHVETRLFDRVRAVHNEEWGPRQSQATKDILVVDDDARNRELIQRALPDYRVLEAETGFEALHILTKYTDVKLILLDLRMPGQHGLQTLKELKRMTPYTPVLVITAYAGEVPSSLLINGMVAGIIEKPFSVRDLARAVDKELAHLDA